MLASEPGAVLGELTVDGLPRIIRVATAYLIPFADEFLPRPQSRALIDIVARLVISYFLAPSPVVDFGDEESARVVPPSIPPCPHRPSSPHQGVAAMSIIEHDPTTTDSEQRNETIRNESIIGRADLDDLEAILAISNTDPDEVEHAVKDNADAIFTWDYCCSGRSFASCTRRPRPDSGTLPPTSTGRSKSTSKRSCRATRSASPPASTPTSTTTP